MQTPHYKSPDDTNSRMVENVSSTRLIAIITSEPITNKNPVIRTTVSRLLAGITERSVTITYQPMFI